ncbi:MAG: ATP-binding cassette domain-containing protein [Spirochaetota bacterium]
MIHCNQVDFFYAKRPPLFRQLSLDIQGGTINGLLGLNGAGKTTLLKILSGQLFPKRGDVSVFGFRPAQRDPKLLRDIYYLPEEFYLPKCTVKEYVNIYSPFYPHFSASDFSHYLEQFELDLNQHVNSYSFGQKKKFLLAFGLATNTSLLILDEPTNGLDIPSKTQFRRTVASAIHDDRAFIISTHQVRDMDHLIDPIIILHDGRVICNRSLSEMEELVSMHIERNEPDGSDVLYYEKVPGGYSVIRRKQEGDEGSPTDMEILFNAVVAVPTLFSTLNPQEHQA